MRPQEEPRSRIVWHRGDEASPFPLLPELEMLGWSSFRETRVHGLTPHRHSAYEICLLTEGAVDWWVEHAGSKETAEPAEAHEYRVGRGDLFVTRPGEWHGGAHTMMHPCVLFWLQVQAMSPLPGMDTATTQALFDRLADLPTHCFPASPEVRVQFEKLVGQHHENNSDLDVSPLTRLAVRAALHTLLIQVVRDVPASAPCSDGPSFSPPADISRALRWMEARLGEPFVVEDAATAVGLSPSRFHERFLSATGQTPAEWRMRRRVEQARLLLADPQATVTAVAHTLGFSSSQHFATVFRRYTGWTPTQYRHTIASHSAIG